MKTKLIHQRSALTIRQRNRALKRKIKLTPLTEAQAEFVTLLESEPSLVSLIERNIPIPPSRGASKGYSDLLRELKAGESRLVPMSRNSARALAHRILGSGNYAVRTDGISADNRATRVWRIK